MLQLAAPHRRFHRSFVAALEEFAASGEERNADLPDWPPDRAFPGVRFTAAELDSRAGFQRYVEHVLAQREPETPRPAMAVPCTELWMAEGREYLGRIWVRHSLDALLLEWGGHIGYAVRPSRRRQGHATRALALMLPLCRDRGLAHVLVTCDEENRFSRRVIEANGGAYEDSRLGKRRYWVPTA